MIDPRRLGVLQAVAVHGSVAGAAGALHLSPPAVSQQLLALERETGASLVDRTGRQVQLTAAGRLLAAHGERVAAQLRQAERDLAELTGRASGPVRIAAFQSVMGPLVGPALRDLAITSPAVQPVITERYGPAAVADLRLGDLDIVLTEYDDVSPPPAEPGLGLRHLAFDPYLLVIPPEWQVRPRGLSDLAGRPWELPATTPCGGSRPRPASASRPGTSALNFPRSLPWSPPGAVRPSSPGWPLASRR
jgi:DNA-binding transcriptional LysR family regulator